jgi:hypothetical protein
MARNADVDKALRTERARKLLGIPSMWGMRTYQRIPWGFNMDIYIYLYGLA